MSSLKSNHQTNSRLVSQLSLLVIGDLLVIVSFVWIGRNSHNLSISNIGASLFTGLPFILGWFLTMPWLGIYKEDARQSWRRMALRLLPGWFFIAGPLSLILRAFFLGRSLSTGIIPTFAIVSLVYIGLVALIWRFGYTWWIGRHRRQDHRLKQSTDISQARG